MKKHTLFIATIILTACQPSGTPADATPGEIQMAEMMGISVEELRHQTPEEHMQMMMQMHTQGAAEVHTIDTTNVPEAKPTEVLLVEDGDTIALNPTLVKKTIHGKAFAMYGYNGQIPGPIVQVKQGSSITVHVKNGIDMETTVHWHGIRLDNQNDGVPDLTQEAIQPDGTYTYTVTLPDEGIYWYHPHVREDIQQDMGLYGNLFVTPKSSDAYSPVHAEQVIVLDDLLVDSNGMPIPHTANNMDSPLMGQFGNALLINGAFIGVGTDQDAPPSIQVAQGSVVRFYITNVANTRTFRLVTTNPGTKMKLVGSDVGRYEHDEFVDSITIAPAERYIVDVQFTEPGKDAIRYLAPEGVRSPFNNVALFDVEVTEDKANPDYSQQFTIEQSHEDVISDIDAYRKYFTAPVDKTLLLDIEMKGHMGMMNHGMMAHDGSGIEWEDTMPGMNAMMTSDDIEWKLVDKDTGASNMNIGWQFAKGDVVKIRIVNNEDSAHPMQHPIHLHGQRFLVLTKDGKENTNLVWKDTVLVPTGSTVDILVDMSNPGTWMMHCHIAEHLTNGMMGMFTVTE